MANFDEIYKRILAVSSSQTQQELAKILEISQSSVSDAKRRQSIPSDWLVTLHDKFGVHLDWLRNKKGPMLMRSLPELGKNTLALQEDTQTLGFIAPVYDTHCTVEDEKMSFTTIEETILPRTLQKNSDLVFAYNGMGMLPILSKPCLLGVSIKRDKNNNIPIISGEIYALYTLAEGIIFRRLVQDTGDDTYLLCFEETKFPHSTIDLEDLRQKLVGKLSWVLHKF